MSHLGAHFDAAEISGQVVSAYYMLSWYFCASSPGHKA